MKWQPNRIEYSLDDMLISIVMRREQYSLPSTVSSCPLMLDNLLLFQQSWVQVWHNSRLGEDTSEHFVQFFVVLDSEHQVSWFHGAPLVVLGGVTGEFQDFSADVLLGSGGHDEGLFGDSHTGLFLGPGLSGWPGESSFGGARDFLGSRFFGNGFSAGHLGGFLCFVFR